MASPPADIKGRQNHAKIRGPAHARSRVKQERVLMMNLPRTWDDMKSVRIVDTESACKTTPTVGIEANGCAIADALGIQLFSSSQRHVVSHKQEFLSFSACPRTERNKSRRSIRIVQHVYGVIRDIPRRAVCECNSQGGQEMGCPAVGHFIVGDANDIVGSPMSEIREKDTPGHDIVRDTQPLWGAHRVENETAPENVVLYNKGVHCCVTNKLNVISENVAFQCDGRMGRACVFQNKGHVSRKRATLNHDRCRCSGIQEHPHVVCERHAHDGDDCLIFVRGVDRCWASLAAGNETDEQEVRPERHTLP